MNDSNKLPTIGQWRVRAVKVPMREPHRTASGVITESPLVLCDVSTDAGAGRSMVFTYTSAALKPTAELVSNLAALTHGQPLAPLDIEQMLAQRFRLLGTQGLVGIAIAAIDMALWDAHARAHGLSLAQALGGAPKGLRAYGGVGYDGVDGCAASAEQWVRRGLRGVKAKIGYPTLAEDLAVVRAMRRAVGDDIAIMVDYNQSLDVVEAEKRLRVLDGEALTWVEEPVLAHDHQGHAQVAAAAATPIQCGENWWGTLDLRHAVDAHASDFVMLDVMKIGGVTGWQRGAAFAAMRGLPVSSHLWPEVSAQLLCATPTAHWLEYADWWNPVLREPLRIEGGLAQVDTRPGSGLEWDEAAVERMLA